MDPRTEHNWEEEQRMRIDAFEASIMTNYRLQAAAIPMTFTGKIPALKWGRNKKDTLRELSSRCNLYSGGIGWVYTSP